MYPSMIANEHQAEFSMFVDELMEESQGKRKEPHLSAYRCVYSSIFLKEITLAEFTVKSIRMSTIQSFQAGDAGSHTPTHLPIYGPGRIF